jgi:uncharacterized oxidoreductase
MPSEPSIRLSSSSLAQLMRDIFSHLDVPAEECQIVVETLLEASLSGYDSHGIMRIPLYVEGIRTGSIVPGAALETLNETASMVHLDAHYGCGPVTVVESIRRASEKAAATGLGCASVVHCTDVARLGSYVKAPAEAGFVALLLVNDAGGNPFVAPWGSSQPFLSTNPLAAGIPWKDGSPIVVDMSTSVAAGGKLKMLDAESRDAPEGWLIDGDGKPTTDVGPALESPPLHALLPLGGLVAGHKGFALSLIIDVLAGALSGAGCSAGKVEVTDRNGLFALVIDPEQFVSRESFNASVEQFVADLKQAKRAPDFDEILMPGERAARERSRREAEGIPVETPVWEQIETILGELGIENRYGQT